MSNTAPNREQHQNLSSTTLNGSHNNSTTSIAVTDGSQFPSSGDYRVMVDDEIMVVTARSTNTLTVVRGQDGTSAASHSDLATIALIYSSQSLGRIFQDNDPLFGYSSVKNQGLLLADDGLTALTLSDFTFQNQGGASASDDNGSIFLTCPTDSGRAIRYLERSAPSTPYTYIAAFSAFSPSMDSDAKPQFGVAFRETSSSKLMIFSFLVESFNDDQNFEVAVSRFSDLNTSFTTNDGPRKLSLVSDLFWVKMEADGTNIKFHLSCDGVNWMQYFSESKTAYFSSGPNKVGWWGCNLLNSSTNATEFHVRLHHWSKGE